MSGTDMTYAPRTWCPVGFFCGGHVLDKEVRNQMQSAAHPVHSVPQLRFVAFSPAEVTCSGRRCDIKDNTQLRFILSSRASKRAG
eukprot:1130503-Rhodomonas_salina.2